MRGHQHLLFVALVTPYATAQIAPARLQQRHIKLGKVLHLQYAHHEVLPRILDQSFYHCLFVRSADQAEVEVEQIVADQLLEFIGQFKFTRGPRSSRS